MNFDKSFEELLNEYNHIIDKDKEKKEYYKNEWDSYDIGNLTIMKCEGNNGDRYYTILNHENNVHVHSVSYSLTKRICKVYFDIKNNRPVKEKINIVRKKALKLFGTKVLY